MSISYRDFLLLVGKLDNIERLLLEQGKEERIMANSVQALQAAVAALATQLQGEDAAIQSIIAALQAASPTGDNPDIDAAVTQLQGFATDSAAQVAAIQAALPATSSAAQGKAPAAPQSPGEEHAASQS